MNKFRIRDNVPDVYVKNSRDFQLLCDLFDVVNNGVKFDIDSIMDLSNTALTRDSMLPYLQDKLGFNTSKELSHECLRVLLKCFPYLNKKKGSKQGICDAICLFLNIIYADCNFNIEVFNNSKTSLDNKYEANLSGNYIIVVYLEDNVLKNLHILNDLLKYVLPTGYILNYDLAYNIDDIETFVDPQDEIRITLMNQHFGSKPRKAFPDGDKKSYINKDDPQHETKFSSVAGAVGTTIIAAYNTEVVDIRTFEEYHINESEEQPT